MTVEFCHVYTLPRKSPPFDRLRAGFLAQRAREKWGTRTGPGMLFALRVL